MGDQRGFGRDGITGLVTADRAMRAREVSRPTPITAEAARAAVAGLDGRGIGPARRG